MKKKLIIFSSIFIILDQVLKLLVRNYLSFEVEKFIIPKFFYLTYAKNTGGAFSILSNNTILLAVIGIMFLIGTIYYVYKKNNISFLEMVSYSLLIGGIFGNIIDRVLLNYVTDYIGLIFGSYYYPIFNLADIGIVVSIIILIFLEFRSGKDGSKSN